MSKYLVKGTVNLKEYSTKLVEKNAKKKLNKIRKELSKIQNTMYAEGKYAVLICLQGMDTSGKDSLIREVFKDVNSQGINVHSFKVPSELEKKHDYLWRHYIALPGRGKIGIFNRTHYENVLVTRVHPEYIVGENIPSATSVEVLNDDFFNNRMEEINNFESHIVNNGTIILKFFLNLSKEEQKNRLLRRLRLKEKNWKFSPGDLKERKLWDAYQFCYEDLLNKTSKENAPWFIIPADDKSTARLLVAETILESLKTYNFKEPELPQKYQVEIENYKKQLQNE
ncbi:MAG: polyphosphate kinase 2 family protein [Lutibacter sp.]|uniref:PPK2 family polyphosphate kinase n=1 Tax=Lutibacter sp. TaxID=1925666 RepID=UPI001841C9F0|nr:PPK2 family polyphosphate kinase [Lutibacter sp.]MBT8317508.1 polyphosphate kinase 2 family protein [Lutibacter sp.]NNJ58367.1 polyphosphate kinase 2 family protein [Lutibacter sp.]